MEIYGSILIVSGCPMMLRTGDCLALSASECSSFLDAYAAGEFGTVLDLFTRLDIAIDVSHALTYLHVYAGISSYEQLDGTVLMDAGHKNLMQQEILW